MRKSLLVLLILSLLVASGLLTACFPAVVIEAVEEGAVVVSEAEIAQEGAVIASELEAAAPVIAEDITTEGFLADVELGGLDLAEQAAVSRLAEVDATAALKGVKDANQLVADHKLSLSEKARENLKNTVRQVTKDATCFAVADKVYYGRWPLSSEVPGFVKGEILGIAFPYNGVSIDLLTGFYDQVLSILKEPDGQVQMTKAAVAAYCPSTVASIPLIGFPYNPRVTGVSYHAVNVGRGGYLNIRAQPGPDNKRVGTIPYNASGVVVTGDGVTVDGQIWVPIRYRDTTGWVNRRYIEQDQVYSAPDVQSSADAIYREKYQQSDSDSDLTLTGLFSNGQATTLTFVYRASKNIPVQVAPPGADDAIYLYDNANQHQYRLLAASGVGFEPSWTYLNQGDELVFTLTFEPLSDDVQTFDMVEGGLRDTSGRVKYWDVLNIER